MRYPERVQRAQWQQLIQASRHTQWGKIHDYRSLRTVADFAERIPTQTYESLQPYIQRMMQGEKDLLWHGQIRNYSKSAGTTAGRSKYLPISEQNLRRCHIRGTWDTMTLFYHNRPDGRQFELKSMLMGGSITEWPDQPKTLVGDVSAIMIKRMPGVARPFFTPDFETALLADWEIKLEKMAKTGAAENRMVMIGGVPTWTVVLFERILELTGADNMLEVWPDLQGYIHGGVSFKPYVQQFKRFFPGNQVSYQEIYNASEGYFAVQDDFSRDDMLLLLDNGIFYEFIPAEEIERGGAKAIPIWEVELGRQYALVISTNSGLWRYLPGDTLTFTSIAPYRVQVTGRTTQYVNAFGEEVIVANTDQALSQTCDLMGASVIDYTVAPVYLGNQQRGRHQWLIEFAKKPANLPAFTTQLDRALQAINSDYAAKRSKDIALEELSIQVLPPGSFKDWLRQKGKIGGQNKVPRLANHRDYVEEILGFLADH